MKIRRIKKVDYEYIYNKEEINTKIKETQNIFKENLNYDYNTISDYYMNISNGINKIQDQNEETHQKQLIGECHYLVGKHSKEKKPNQYP